MSSQSIEIALSAQNLTKRYGTLTAVDSISLSIQEGLIFGILGPNGAGKSTTIKMLCGLMRPDNGTIKIFGKGLNLKSTVGAIGLSPQELVIWDDLTLMEQLLFIAEMYDIDIRAARIRADELLEAMYLQDKKDKRASTLSGGMKRRLNILLALMHDPRILILDEPQAGLDPQSRILVRDYLKGLAEKKTVIVTTHDMEEADKISDRVVIMDNGRILAEDTPLHLKDSLYKGDIVELSITDIEKLNEGINVELEKRCDSVSIQGRTIRVVSEKPMEAIIAAQQIISSGGMTVEDVKIRKCSLEDVFISLTGRGLRE